MTPGGEGVVLASTRFEAWRSMAARAGALERRFAREGSFGGSLPTSCSVGRVATTGRLAVGEKRGNFLDKEE